MSMASEEVQKQRHELRAAEAIARRAEARTRGEDPVLLPERRCRRGGMPHTSEFDVRIATQKKLLDELLRRYTDQHPDVVSAKRRLIAQLEQQKKQELDARRKSAAENPNKFSRLRRIPCSSRLKISLADAEANIAALRARLSEARRGWRS